MVGKKNKTLMSKKIKKIFNSIEAIVFYRIIRLILVMIRKYYNYDSWHDSFFNDRPYAKKIVSHLNLRDIKNSALEIGCGTGDIIRRLKFQRKYGYDYEVNVLKCLKFLSLFQNYGGKIRTKKFNFNKEEIVKNYDVIILVNWIHNIEQKNLSQKLKKYYYKNLNIGGELIIDAMSNTNYKYNHNISTLTKNLNCKIQNLGSFKYGRTIFSILKT